MGVLTQRTPDAIGAIGYDFEQTARQIQKDS